MTGGDWKMISKHPSARKSMENLSKIYRKSIAGMSLLACKVKSAGCFLGGVCGSLLSVR